MSMTGIVYRPPFEADSLLLEVTTGCSHNRCRFCSMYRGVPFSVCPREHIEAQLEEAARGGRAYTRAFLENGDAFVLPAERLCGIADAIRRRFPDVKTVSMYASIGNIRGKTNEELQKLRDGGVNELNIGVESGLDAALTFMNKGYTAAEARRQLARLTRAGIDFSLNVILGCAGPALSRENAEATAALLNEAQPYLLFVGTLHAEPGSPLFDEIRSGAAAEPTFGQLLDEQEELLRRLELQNTVYFGAHPSNVLPMRGMLPQHREEMLRAVREERRELANRLDTIPVRGGEGAILNR